jgi:hypothetical protein
MVARPTLRTKAVIRRTAEALAEFAKEQGWKKDQYQLLFHLQEEWGRITVMLVAEDFGGRSDREMWDLVYDYLQRSLKQEGDIGFSLGLAVREKSQVEKGGLYSIPDTYVEVADLLPASSLDD